jgi:ATP-dependent DNA helicase RecG
MNLIYEESIRHSKAVPDFAQTDKYQVGMTLHGTVQDPNFVRFLEKVSKERAVAFSTQDFLILDLIHREQKLTEPLKLRVADLLEQGVVERVARGKFVLSRKFYSFVGQKGVYTRKRGLDREQNKTLLLKHIEDNRAEGSPLQDLMQVLPALSRNQVQKLLQELRHEGKAHNIGPTRASRWNPGPAPPAIAPKN